MTVRIKRNPPMVSSRTKVGKTFGVLGKLVGSDNPDGKRARDTGVRVRGRRGR